MKAPKSMLHPRKPSLSAMLAIAAMCSASGAHAHDWANVGGWEIVESDAGCAMWKDFEGPGDSELLISIKANNEVVVGVQNSNWSLLKDQRYKILIAMKDYGWHTSAI